MADEKIIQAMSVNNAAECELSGRTAADYPINNYGLSRQQLVAKFSEGVKLFHEAAEKLGHKFSKEIFDVGLVEIGAAIESSFGTNAYTEGNSYIGPLGQKPYGSPNSSHFMADLDSTVKYVNAVSDKIPDLNGCHATRITLLDEKHFNNITIPVIAYNNSLGKIYNSLSTNKNFASLNPVQQKVMLYGYHNLPAVGQVVLDNLDSKSSIRKLLSDKYGKEGVETFHQIEKMMKDNPHIHNEKNTPREWLDNLVQFSTKLVSPGSEVAHKINPPSVKNNSPVPVQPSVAAVPASPVISPKVAQAHTSTVATPAFIPPLPEARPPSAPHALQVVTAAANPIVVKTSASPQDPKTYDPNYIGPSGTGTPQPPGQKPHYGALKTSQSYDQIGDANTGGGSGVPTTLNEQARQIQNSKLAAIPRMH